MRIALIAVCFVSSVGMAWAQGVPENKTADKPESSTGRTVTPETKGQLQPQGWTGPINTNSLLKNLEIEVLLSLEGQCFWCARSFEALLVV